MTLEIMMHGKTLAGAPDTPGTPLTPGPIPSDPVPLGIMNNYETSACKRVRREELRTIYALVCRNAGGRLKMNERYRIRSRSAIAEVPKARRHFDSYNSR